MDLFDRLPDELLTHIISFLPTKDAIVTSVLSRRWKFLWCYADNLVFDDSVSFHGLREDVGYYGLDEDGHTRVLPFKNFVDRVLELNKAPQVGKFFLKMYSNYRALNPVHSWLDHIVSKRHVKEIEIHFSLDVCSNLSGVFFPLSTFSSVSLRVLKLYFGNSNALRGIDYSKSLYLPNLKILHFWMDNNIYVKWWVLSFLFRASPVLEEAYFGGNLKKSRVFCNIYAPSLKRLRMIFRSIESSNKFLINAPILEDLVVVDESFQHHVVKSNCLATAKLDIGFPHVREFEGRVYNHRVCKLLCRISNVKFMNLKAHTMDALSMCCKSMLNMLPQFHNLCHLKLCFLNYSSWDVIAILLECAPNLQVLAISKDFKGKDVHFRRDSVWIQPSSVPTCLLSSLRQVEVWDCESHEAEFNLINYLLQHGDALSTFLVELLPADSRDDLRFREKLMLIPRVSKTCELKVSLYPHCSQHRSISPVQENKSHLTNLQRRMPPRKMSFEDLRVFTNYFSEVQLIMRTKKFKLYRGKLFQSSSMASPFTDIVVKKWVIRANSPYNKHKERSVYSFREELKLLENPNIKYHPYFVNMLGYCAEDYDERLGVVYDFKPLDCLQNLIPKDSFKWLQRIKVALVLACISEYMQKKHEELPYVLPRMHPSSIVLDEDYTPALFHYYHDSSIESMCYGDGYVYRFGLALLGLISKRVHRCPIGRHHTPDCRTMSRWATMQVDDRYISSSLCKSQIPLVHKSLMKDSTYDIVDGLKLTRIALRCYGLSRQVPSMHAIIKYLCKLRIVRENWDVLDCDKILGEHHNVRVS